MKLERLEGLNTLNIKKLIITEVMSNLEDATYYNPYEVRANLCLIYATLFGNTETHQEMSRKDIDWLDFVEKVNILVDEIEKGDFALQHKEVVETLEDCIKQQLEYKRSISGIFSEIGKLFNEDNLAKIKEGMNTKGE